MRWDWIAYGVLAAVLLYIVIVFNRLVRQRNVVREAWSGIDVQLKRRTDLVPALVETVKGYATHERTLLEEVTAKRAMSLDAQAQGNVAQNAQATQQLGSAVGRLIAVAEAYPQLKANENFLKLQEQLSEIEEQLQYARRYYNGAVRNLNISIQSFPELLIAKPFGFSERPFFELEDRAQGNNPNISFDRGSLSMRRILLAAFVVIATQVSAFAQERILNFVSDVVVQTNGDLDVTETITIQAEGNQFRRGIFRDFPTSYRRRSDGINVVVGFSVISVTHNGQAENYTTESVSNGVRTKIGNANVFIPRGQHTYVIRYRTTRQLGFFETFDELYWNATGNGWDFYIDNAEARITLPQGAQIGQNSLYTGAQGDTGKDARIVEQTQNRIVWRTTRRLPPKNGLTVAVAWQKGIVSPPSGAQQATYFFQDNLPILAALIGIIGIGFFYLSTWSRVGRDPPAGTVIPLFGPPNDMSPAAARYLDQLSFDNRAFTAAIVDLGVKGHLSMSETPTFTQLSSRNGGKKLSAAEEQMRIHLFAGGNSLALTQSNHAVIGGAKTILESKLSEQYNGKMFSNNYGWSFLGFFLAIIAIAVIVFAVVSTKSGDEVAAGMVGTFIPGGVMLVANFIMMAGFTSHKRWNLWIIVGGILWLLCAVGGIAIIYALGGGVNLNLMIPAIAAWVIEAVAMFAFYWLKAPSREGQQIRDQISGFREYLEVAEEDRLNAMNPPKKTPELFEKFLPYAIALDCENAWGKKFAGVLAAAAAAGAAGYAWYHGSRDWSRDPAGFSNHLGSSVAAAISSASTAPGSSSGSSGGGSSGGGGGGGGGGGW